MELIALWILCSAVVGLIAQDKGYSWLGWSLFSIVLSPVIGFIVVLCIPEIKKQEKSSESNAMDMNKLSQKSNER